MPRFPAALALILCGGSTHVMIAQSISASLGGRVIDPSKAVIAGAKVAAISTNTGAEHDATSDASGVYEFSDLPPGSYSLEVEKTGFKKLIRRDVILHVQDALEIDFVMAVGAVTETITVQGGAPLVNTESATVSTLIDRTFADNLPLNGRTFQTMIMLAPGVVVSPTAFDDQGQFSVNGQRTDANYFTVDGMSANFGVTGYFPLVQAAGGALPALSISGGTNSLVSVDAMLEFRIQTSSFAPEFGRTPGGQVSIVTRTGTNSFHGTAFDYFRNDLLDANDWFNGYTNSPPLPKAKERQNDFGGTLGGPILKDKAFFLFSYEGLRLRQPSTQETVVPDNASRQQAPPAIQPFINAYPVANGTEVGNGLAQFDASYSDPSSLDAYSMRADLIATPRVTFVGRYNYSPSSLDQRGAFPPPYTVLSATESASSSVQTFTLGTDQRITPLLANEFRANYSNQRLGTSYSLDNFGRAVPLSDSLLFPPGFSSQNGLFLQFIPGVGEFGQGESATDEQRQINLIDNISLNKHTHQLKFGVDYRWLSPFSVPFNYEQFVEFSGVACPASGSCEGYALSGTGLGNATTATFAQSTSSEGDALISENYSLYGQDTWRITPQLAVSYGLRWDVNPPLSGKNSANDPFTVVGLSDPATMSLAPRGTPLYQTTYGNVAPRFGVAYRMGANPNRETVLRAGVGVFFELGQGSLGGVSSYFPYNNSNFFFNVPFPLSTQNLAPPALTTNPPVGTILVADPHLKLPRTYEWNGALEQSLGSAQSFSLTYVGALGRDMLRVTDLINLNPDFQNVALTDNSAYSNYQALQAKFERRLSYGLQVLASYTWSHSIDIASTDAFANYLNTPGLLANPNIDRGDSDFDIRSSFTAGVTYNLPSPEWNTVARGVLRNWSIDSFMLLRTAPPVDVTSGLVFAGSIAMYPRPDVVPGMPLELYGSQYPGGKILNGAAFTAPATGQQGNFRRNALRALGAAQADVAFQRQFHLTERVGLRFRGEFFNIINHPNFGPPDNNITDTLFGYSTETLASSLGSGGANGGLNPLYQIGGPRSIQLAAKLQF